MTKGNTLYLKRQSLWFRVTHRSTDIMAKPQEKRRLLAVIYGCKTAKKSAV